MQIEIKVKDDKEVLKRKVTEFGTGAHVIVPKKMMADDVMIVSSGNKSKKKEVKKNGHEKVTRKAKKPKK